MERAEQLKELMTALEATEDVLQENERLEEKDLLRQQLKASGLIDDIESGGQVHDRLWRASHATSPPNLIEVSITVSQITVLFQGGCA